VTAAVGRGGRIARPAWALLVATALLVDARPGPALTVGVASAPAVVDTGPSAGPPRVDFEVAVGPRPVGDGRLADRTFEPIVATHPTDPGRIAVSFRGRSR
jgi:hypothetical protein